MRAVGTLTDPSGRDTTKFNKNTTALGGIFIKSWRAQKDSNPQPFDP